MPKAMSEESEDYEESDNDLDEIFLRMTVKIFIQIYSHLGRNLNMMPHEKSKPQLMIHRKVMSMIKSPNIIASITIIRTTGENYRCSQMTQTPAKSAEFFFCTTSLTVPATSPQKKQVIEEKYIFYGSTMPKPLSKKSKPTAQLKTSCQLLELSSVTWYIPIYSLTVKQNVSMFSSRPA